MEVSPLSPPPHLFPSLPLSLLTPSYPLFHFSPPLLLWRRESFHFQPWLKLRSRKHPWAGADRSQPGLRLGDEVLFLSMTQMRKKETKRGGLYEREPASQTAAPDLDRAWGVLRGEKTGWQTRMNLLWSQREFFVPGYPSLLRASPTFCVMTS